MQGDSPIHHEKRGRLYAEAKGWEVAKFYKLEAMSGKSVMGYPETKRMLEDIRKGEISGLIFSKLARLARNTKELLEFSDIFKENNADLISLEESIDTSSPAGRLFYTMIAAMGQWEREEISSRIIASIPIRAKMGKSVGGQTPLGYKFENNQLVIDEKEAPIRKLMYELFLKYKRKKTVARELNAMGYVTRGGLPFSDMSVTRLLKDTTAKGIRRANFTITPVPGKHPQLKPESEWIYYPCPPLVPEGIWNECNRIMDEKEKKFQKKGRLGVFLLSGMVHCTCGKKMYVYHAAPVYDCRPCKKRIAVSDLDEIFLNQLKSFLMTDRQVSDFNKSTDVKIKVKEALLANVSKEAEELAKTIENLVNLRITGEMDKDRFAIHYRPAEDRLQLLENQLPELQAEVDFLKIQYASSDVILTDAKNLYDRWPDLPFEQKRTIIETITEKITVGTEDISIKLSYLPTFSENTGKRQHEHAIMC
jgi:site-specific DNA recombinase